MTKLFAALMATIMITTSALADPPELTKIDIDLQTFYDLIARTQRPQTLLYARTRAIVATTQTGTNVNCAASAAVLEQAGCTEITDAQPAAGSRLNTCLFVSSNCRPILNYGQITEILGPDLEFSKEAAVRRMNLTSCTRYENSLTLSAPAGHSMSSICIEKSDGRHAKAKPAKAAKARIPASKH